MKRSTAFLLILLIAGAGYFVVLPRLPALLMATGGGEALGVKPLDVDVVSVSPSGVNTDGATMRLDLRVTNPNSFDARVDRISYRIYEADGALVADGSTPYTYTVPGHRSITIQSTFQVDWIGSLQGLEDKLTGWLTGETPIWTIEGAVHVDAGPTTFDIPFSSEFEV